MVIVKESKTKWIYVVKTVRTYSYGYHKMTCVLQQTSLALCFVFRIQVTRMIL